MPAVDNDFGAGLDLDQQGGGVAVDPFVSGFRDHFDGLPEDATSDTIVEHIKGIQALADEAPDLKRRLEELQEQHAQLLANANKPDANAAEAAAQQAQNAQQAEAQRRYKAAASVDAHLQPYLTAAFVQTDSNGNYLAKEEHKFNPGVRQACDAMNAQLDHQRRLIQDFTTDPYSFGEELVSHSSVVKTLRQELADFKKQHEEYIKQLDSRFTPLQQNAEEAKLQALVAQNHSLLTMPKMGATDPNERDWSLAGEIFNDARANGSTPEKALELAQKYAAKYPTAMAAVAKPEAPKKPRLYDRVVDRYQQSGIRPREVGSRNQAYEPPAPRDPGSFAELKEQILAGN